MADEDEPEKKRLKIETESDWEHTFDSLTPQDRLCVLSNLIAKCSHPELIHLHCSLMPRLKRDFVSHLPTELSLRILGELSPRDLLVCAQVSRRWRLLAEDPHLWRRQGGKRAYQRARQVRCNWLRGVSTARPVHGPCRLPGATLPSMLTLPAHDNHVITCLEMWRNLIVSASDDSTIRLWRADTGQLVRTLTGHIGGVWSTAIVDDLLVSGSTDRTVRVWCMKTGICRHTLAGHVSTVRCLAGRGSHVTSGSRDTSLRVWDLHTGACQVVLHGHRAAVRAVQWLSDSELVSASYDSTVRVWCIEPSSRGPYYCKYVLDQHINRVYTLAATPQYIVSGSLDTTIRVWRSSDGQLIRTLLGHQSLTAGMLVLPDGRLVSGNADTTLRVWDLSTGQCQHVLGLGGQDKHQSAITSVQIVQDFIVSASDDGTVKMWSATTGQFVRDLLRLESAGHGGVVWRICASDTRLVCAAGSRNGSEDAKLIVLNFDPEAVSQAPHACNRVGCGVCGAGGGSGASSSGAPSYCCCSSQSPGVGILQDLIGYAEDEAADEQRL
ncbi:hypothetical protein BOX15_Mlig029670g1 [Macrostomum lignano]|uniref:Uncharacterized protein n=2 Tax=Macrostomum lignano TaxID=282301 RepID=A0A267GJX7_9PLAT|nr:hypothetical protein BOX15_Mlig029670g1 [Macrostomum lignano]